MAQQGTNTLFAGQKLTEGQRLISANKVYYVAVQADGNLCLKKTNGDEFIWCSMVYLGSGHSLTLQADGNLVVYNKENKPVWSSETQAFFDPKFGTADNKPVRAVLEDNGTLNLYSATNKKVWDNNYNEQQNTTLACEAKKAVKKYQTSMKPGERLAENEKLVSANGRYHLRVTTDGNFVIEEVLNSGNCPYKEIYRFPINNGGSKPAVSFFSYNPDGNVCMDNKQGKTYCATTGRDAVAALILGKSVKLEMTDDGRLILVNKAGQEIWATSFSSK